MRQTISKLIAVFAIAAASAAPAMACGGIGWFEGGCSPCGIPCAQSYVLAPVYLGCNGGCGGWVYERLPDPVHQYYYVNQGPTYSGPGNFAPYPTYQESALPNWGAYRHRHYYWHGHSGYRHHYGYREHTLRRYY